MSIQQIVTINLAIQGDGSSTAFTFGINKLMQASTQVGTLLNMNTVPSGASFHNDGSSPINATATVDSFGNLTITFNSAPANGQVISIWCDLLFNGSASLSGATATWTSGTAANTTISIALSGSGTVVVPIIASGTVTGGAIVFEASPDNTNWFTITGTIPANFQPISSWAVAAGSTLITFTVTGYSYFRARLSSVLTGTSPQAAVSMNSLATASNGLVSAGAVTTFSTTSPTPTNGSQTPIQCSPNGNLVVQEYRRSQIVTQSTTSTTTGAKTILAAQGAGVFADITDLNISVASSATAAALTMTLSDGTVSYIFDMNVDAAVGCQFLNMDFDPPLPATTANTAWTLTTSASTTTHITVIAVKQTSNF